MQLKVGCFGQKMFVRHCTWFLPSFFFLSDTKIGWKLSEKTNSNKILSYVKIKTIKQK